MKFEFSEDDVVVEIMDMEGFRYVIHPVDIDEDGYFLDSIVNGVRCDTCFWRSWDEAHEGLVKVGVWNGTMEVDDEED
jgi:hypothetical protein